MPSPSSTSNVGILRRIYENGLLDFDIKTGFLEEVAPPSFLIRISSLAHEGLRQYIVGKRADCANFLSSVCTNAAFV